jgi:hypothetical protein
VWVALMCRHVVKRRPAVMDRDRSAVGARLAEKSAVSRKSAVNHINKPS